MDIDVACFWNIVYWRVPTFLGRSFQVDGANMVVWDCIEQRLYERVYHARYLMAQALRVWVASVPGWQGEFPRHERRLLECVETHGRFAQYPTLVIRAEPIDMLLKHLERGLVLRITLDAGEVGSPHEPLGPESVVDPLERVVRVPIWVWFSLLVRDELDKDIGILGKVEDGLHSGVGWVFYARSAAVVVEGDGHFRVAGDDGLDVRVHLGWAV